MSARKDSVEISIAFLTDESRQYAKLVNENQKFIEDLKKAQKEGKELTEVVNKMADSGQAIAKIPLDKLAPAQLIQRANQLKQVLDLIPQSAPQYKALAAEYKSINDQLATMRAETKGVAEGMQAAGKGGGFFKNAMSGLIGVFGGFTLVGAISTLLDFGKTLFGIGSELEGMRQKTQTVFGESAVIVEGFAEKNANALGLARQDYINLATAAGDLLIPMGFTQDTAAKLSAELVNQGGILAAWSKGKVDAQGATEILQKALLGERDALNTLGIDIKDSLIQDELKKRGLADLTGESKRQAEALVTLEQITKQSASANEDFANNTENLSRKKAELRARVSEIVQRISTGLVPVFEKIISVAGPLIDAVFQLGSSLFSMGEKLGVFKFAGVLFDTFLTTTKQLVGVIGSVAQGIGQLVDGEFSKAWDTLKNGFSNAVSDGAKTMKSAYTTLFGNGSEVAKSSEEGGKTIARAWGDGYDAEFKRLSKTGEREVKESVKKRLDAQRKAIEERKEDIAKNFALLNPVGTKSVPGSVQSQGDNRITQDLREKFAKVVSLEGNFTRQLAAERLNAANDRLRDMRDMGLQETTAFKEAKDAQLAAEIAYAEAVRKQESLTAQVRRQAIEEVSSVAGDALAIGIELLSKDEAARKKHASAIKAFEIAQVTISTASEIQGIWRNANSNPINALIPGWGPIFAGIQTALAVARATAQIRKINSVKFATGGYTGPGYGAPDPTGYRPAGIVHEGEWVSPAWMVGHPVYGRQVNLLENVRRRGFATGGFADTAPMPGPTPTPSAGDDASTEAKKMRMEFAALRKDISGWQRNLRVAVVHGDIEEASATKRALVEAVGI